MLEELDLSETLLGLCLSLVWSAQVFIALLGHHFVSALNFYDHIRTPSLIFGKAAQQCQWMNPCRRLIAAVEQEAIHD